MTAMWCNISQAADRKKCPGISDIFFIRAQKYSEKHKQDADADTI